jgi:hypothetical protein
MNIDSKDSIKKDLKKYQAIFFPTGEIGFGTVPPPVPPSTPAIFADPVRYEFFGSVSIRNNGNVGLFFGREYVPSSSAAYYYGQWGIQYVPADPANNLPVGGLNFWKPFQSTGNASGQNALLFLNDDGNVGIGCSNPQYKLGVNGNVRIGTTSSTQHTDALLQVDGKCVSQSFYVSKPMLWQDIVFTSELPSLTEVGIFTKKYKHLLFIPSENEVMRNGNDVNEMNALLLKQEMLYLYIFQQVNKINEISNQINKRISKKIKLYVG